MLSTDTATSISIAANNVATMHMHMHRSGRHVSVRPSIDNSEDFAKDAKCLSAVQDL